MTIPTQAHLLCKSPLTPLYTHGTCTRIVINHCPCLEDEVQRFPTPEPALHSTDRTSTCHRDTCEPRTIDPAIKY